MKKFLVCLSLILLVIATIAVFIISIPYVNDSLAKDVEKQLKIIELPDKTEMIESLSIAGKIVGNGNGMQYFGAILIKSEKTLDELSAYYSGKLDGILVKEQKSKEIEFTHGDVSFSSNINEEGNYFIVYLFGDGIFPFSELDIRGH